MDGLRPARANAIFFFLMPTATTAIYTLSLHDALPIYAFAYAFLAFAAVSLHRRILWFSPWRQAAHVLVLLLDRKSTRLNSSHQIISYAVFCLKKKKNTLSTFTYIPHHQHYAPISPSMS